MASLRYSLRDKHATKPTPIHFTINFSIKERLRGSTSLKILPKYWDNDKQKARNVIELSDSKDEINLKLSNFSSYIEAKLVENKNKSISKQKQLLKEDIDIFLGKKTTQEKLTLYPFINKFIEQSENRIVEKTGKTISIRTIQDYNRTKELLKEFEKKNKYPISFDTINLDFYYLFKKFLENLDFAPNTIGKYIKLIKVFMNEAIKQELTTNTTHKRFIQPSEKSIQIYLDESELNRILSLDLTNKPRLDNARNLFIIGAYTGLRVSDFNGLTKENIGVYNGVRVFRIQVKKTNKYLPIPIHPIIENILKKTNGNPPKKMRNQEINDALLEIGKLAKIDDVITINRILGGKKETIMKRKYEMIKNHTARRSFCTNAYISGMPVVDIMAISGHASEKTFLNYIKISADDRAVKIFESDFFKPKADLTVVK